MQSKIDSNDQPTRSFIETARRAQIIDEAVATIAELGFAQASLARIAKRARISAGVISYYFAGKDDLIAEVAAHVFAAGEAWVRPKVQQATTAREALRVFLIASVDYIATSPSNVLAMMNIVHAGPKPDGAPRFDPAVTRGRSEGLTRVLEWGQKTGEFRAFAVPVMVTTVIQALNGVTPALALDPRLDLAAYATELADLFDRATRKDIP